MSDQIPHSEEDDPKDPSQARTDVYVPAVPDLEKIMARAAEEIRECVRNDLEPSLPAAELHKGDVLPRGEHWRFKVLFPCGRGGTAKLYRVQDERCPNRPTVVKVVGTDGPLRFALSRLIEEAQNTASLNPDHCTPCVIDWGLEPNFAWFAMEYFEGLTLAALLKNEGPRTWAQAKKVCEDVLTGLHYAHSRDVIHGDLTPANLILPNNRGHWMILDWGFARIVDTQTGKTFDHCPSGTPSYMAPECCGSHADPRGCYSRQSDLYAVGMILAELLIGKPSIAFTRDLNKIREAHQTKDLAAELAQVPGLPEEARRIVLRATDPDPSKRYQDAREFLDDLDRPVKPTERRRRLVVLGLLGVLVLALAAVLIWFPRTPPAPAHFDGDLDLWVVAEGKERLLRPLVVGGPKARPPLHAGQGVVAQGKLKQGPPAFFYVIWIHSDGKPNGVYPDGWSGDQLPAAETPQRDFRWPKTDWLTLPPRRDGLELVLWLVRERRLTSADNTRIHGLLQDIKWHQPEKWKGKDMVLWWNNGNLLKAGDRGVVPPQARTPDDPLSQTEKLLQALKDQGLASYTFALAYSVTEH